MNQKLAWALSLSAAVVTALSCAPAAQATTVDTIVTVPFSVAGGDSAAVDIPQFDPTLGTLTAVTLTEMAAENYVFEVFTSGQDATFQALAQNSFVFSLGGLAQPGFLAGSGSVPAGSTVFTTASATTPLGTLQFNFGPYADAMFIGTGALNTSVSLSAASVTQSSGTNLQGVLAFAGANGAVTVDYAYTPNAVPEPATFGLCGTSLFLAGIARRRLRRTKTIS